MATEVSRAPVGKDATPADRASEPTLSQLVGGIVEDGQKLFEHQFALLKLDFRRDLDRARETGIILGFAFSLLSAGGLVLLIMVVHLLEWLTRPQWEWWVCYALVGGTVVLIGGALFYHGKKKLDSLSVIPEQTAKALE